MKNGLSDIIERLQAGQFSEALIQLESYRPAPREEKLCLYLRAIASFNTGHLASAQRYFEQCIEDESPIDWWINYGIFCRDAGAWAALDEVAAHLQQRKSRGYEVTTLIAESHRRRCELDEAVECYETELQCNPEAPKLLLGYANALRDARRYQQALDVFESPAIKLQDPEIRWNQALTQLAMGPSNLPNLESRFQRTPSPYLEYQPKNLARLPQLTQPSKQRLLLVSEQGFGDTLQFARYVAALHSTYPSLGWVVPQRLVRLLRLSFPSVRLLSSSEVNEAEWDAWLPLLSTGYQGLKPDAAPYLHAPKLPPSLEAYRGTVLLNWAGSSTYIHDFWRSLTAEDFFPLCSGETTFETVSIQHGLNELQRRQLPESVIAIGHLLDIGDDGFYETAALFSVAKALVTTDTAVAHLAGALGLQTHLVLGPLADWRWEWEEETTPWYPSTTLHRWKSRDEIPKLMKKIRAALN